MPKRFPSNNRRAAGKALPYLILHHEEFAWPRLLPNAPVSSYLTISPIIPKSGLVCFLLHLSSPTDRGPGVTRLDALWCSDFPPRRIAAIARSASLHGIKHYSKIVLNIKTEDFAVIGTADRTNATSGYL